MSENDPKKAVLIIAEQTFRDEELFDTQLALESASVETVIASTKIGTCTGKLGRNAEASAGPPRTLTLSVQLEATLAAVSSSGVRASDGSRAYWAGRVTVCGRCWTPGPIRVVPSTSSWGAILSRPPGSTWRGWRPRRASIDKRWI